VVLRSVEIVSCIDWQYFMTIASYCLRVKYYDMFVYCCHCCFSKLLKYCGELSSALVDR